MRFTLGGLMLWVAFGSLALAIVVPLWQSGRRTSYDENFFAVAISADASTIAALKANGRLLVWDRHGRPKANIPTSGHDLALSFDGRFAIVGHGAGAGTSPGIDVWNTSTGELVDRLPTYMPIVASSPSDSTMAATINGHLGHHPVIELHSLPDRKHLGTIVTASAGRSPGLFRFSADGKRLAAWWQDLDDPSVRGPSDRVDLYDTPTQQIVQRLECPDADHSRIADLAWSSDGEHLAAIRSFNHFGERPIPSQLQIWDLSTAQRRSKPLPDGARWLAYVADGRQIAIVGRGGISLFDATTLEAIRREEAESITHWAASARGDAFVSVRDGRIVEVWDGPTPKRQRELIAADRLGAWPVVCGVFLLLVALAARRRARSNRRGAA